MLLYRVIEIKIFKKILLYKNTFPYLCSPDSKSGKRRKFN